MLVAVNGCVEEMLINQLTSTIDMMIRHDAEEIILNMVLVCFNCPWMVVGLPRLLVKTHRFVVFVPWRFNYYPTTSSLLSLLKILLLRCRLAVINKVHSYQLHKVRVIYSPILSWAKIRQGVTFKFLRCCCCCVAISEISNLLSVITGSALGWWLLRFSSPSISLSEL